MILNAVHCVFYYFALNKIELSLSFSPGGSTHQEFNTRARERLMACLSQWDNVALDWQLKREGAQFYGSNFPRMKLPWNWAEGFGESGSRLRCHRLSMFLSSFSIFFFNICFFIGLCSRVIFKTVYGILKSWRTGSMELLKVPCQKWNLSVCF